MSMNSYLPRGWAWSKLGELGEYINGRGFSKAEWSARGRPIIRIQDLTGTGDAPNFFEGIVEPKYLVKPGDLLVSWAATLGAYIWRGPEGWLNQHIFRVESHIDQRFHYYLITSVLSDLYRQTHGSGMVHITRGRFDGLDVPLPPLAEQRRIVAAIEQQFTRLDAGVAALKRAQVALKRYRAAVLKAAVEGKLTEDWRAAHPDAEPAATLLKRILAERRARWEADLRAKGKDPAKAKYEEPKAPDTASLPELQEGWCWATFEQISARVTVGHVGSMKDEYVNEGIPFLRGQNVRPNRFDPEGLKYISPQFHNKLSKSVLYPGDILIVRSGAVGTACVMPDTYSEANCSDLVIVQRPAVNANYAAYYMNSTAQAAVQAQKVGIALTHFNTQSLAMLPMPLPPLAEQEQIVAEVERRLSVVSELEATVAANLKRAERLRQSILERAFSGRLVPQDPTDEPASALLERIREERQSLTLEQQARVSRGRTKTDAKQYGHSIGDAQLNLTNQSTSENLKQGRLQM